MIGVVRILAVLAGVVVAGCQTDGLVGPEASGAAKQRVIDTPKTAPRTTASKKDSGAVAQGDVSARSADASDRASARPIQAAAASPGSSAPAGGDTAAIPAQTLFGNWTLVDNSGRKCRLILGGVLVGAAYSARGEADCPHAFVTVQSWEIQGPELILRNQSRGVIGRLQPTGPARFDGRAEGGAVYLIR